MATAVECRTEENIQVICTLGVALISRSHISMLLYNVLVAR